MAKRKFRSSAQGRGFKQLGSGLRAAEDRIQEQRKREIDSLKLSALQRKEDDQNYISGMDRAFGMEEFQRKERVKLEDKVRTRKYEALKKLADTDVKRLEDEAKMKQKEVDYWKELTPKAAKALQSSITGIYQFQDTYRGQKYYQALRESGLLEGLVDEQKNVTDLFNKDFFKDFRAGKINKDNIENYIVSDALWDKHKNRTSRGALLLLDYLKKNKGSLTAEVVAEAQAAGHTISNTEYADLHEWAAMAILKNAGIPATSRRGSQIIELYRSEGLKVQKNKLLAENHTKDQGDIANQVKALFALIGQNEDITEEAKNLVSMVYGSHTKVGDVIKAPHENGMSWPSAFYGTGTSIVDVSFKDIRGREHLKEILSKFWTIPKEGSTEKSEQFIKKHEHVTEQILEYYDKKVAEKEKQGSVKQNEYNVQSTLKLQRMIGNQAWQFKTNDNGDLVLENGEKVPLPEGELLSKKDWMFSQIRRISKDAQLNDSGRQDAFAELGLIGDTHKVAEQYVIAKEYYDQGNPQKARNYINSQSAGDQNILAPLFEDIQILEKAVIPIQERKGRKALTYRVKTEIFQFAEGENYSPTNSKMHPSASPAQVAFVDAVEIETLRLWKTGKYDTEHDAYEAAFTTIKKEYDLGEEGKGRWRRVGALETKPGVSGKFLRYTKYDGVIDDSEAERLTALNKVGLAKDLEEVKNADTFHWSEDNMNLILRENLLSGGHITEDANDRNLLMNVRFVGNDEYTSLVEGALAFKNGSPDANKWYPIIPNNLKIWAKARGISNLEAVDILIEARWKGPGPAPQLPPGSREITKNIKNDGNFVSEYNEPGVCAFAACTAQGVNPMSFNSAYQLEGLGISDSFLKQFPDANNPADFLKNGGLYRTPVDYSTLEQINLAFFTDRNQTQFPLNNGKPVSIIYANPEDKGTALGAEKKNRFGNTLVYSVVSGSNANKTLGWKLKSKKDPNIKGTSTDRYRLDRGSL